MPSQREALGERRLVRRCFEQSALASHPRHHDRGSPGVAATVPSASAPARGLQLVSPKETTMFYGIGGTILIVLLVLFFLGRL